MNRRNFTTAVMAVGAVVLLYAGVAMARQPERAPVLGGVAPKASLVADDHGRDRNAEPTDDHAVHASIVPAATDSGDIDVADDRDAQPSASPDDRGRDASATAPGDDRGGDDRATPAPSPTASADDHGNDVADSTPATATASPDDHGGNAANPTPTASPDDRGGLTGGAASPTPTATASDDPGHGGDN